MAIFNYGIKPIHQQLLRQELFQRQHRQAHQAQPPQLPQQAQLPQKALFQCLHRSTTNTVIQTYYMIPKNIKIFNSLDGDQKATAI